MFLALLLYEILEGTILIKLINISLKPSIFIDEMKKKYFQTV